MNAEHLDVARVLLEKAEQLNRWSRHDRTPADVEAGPVRAALARRYARAAFALLGAEPRGHGGTEGAVRSGALREDGVDDRSSTPQLRLREDSKGSGAKSGPLKSGGLSVTAGHE